jgi:hypothetical protein
MPFSLIEGVYENMHGAHERQLRTLAYQALLCGATGHVFGNDRSGTSICPATLRRRR